MVPRLEGLVPVSGRNVELGSLSEYSHVALGGIHYRNKITPLQSR